MKRYVMFAWQSYYPSGGWGDSVGQYETLGEAHAAVVPELVGSAQHGSVAEYVELVDIETGGAVTSWERDHDQRSRWVPWLCLQHDTDTPRNEQADHQFATTGVSAPGYHWYWPWADCCILASGHPGDHYAWGRGSWPNEYDE